MLSTATPTAAYAYPLLRLQEQVPSAPGTYVWLAVGGLLLVLGLLAFGYLLVRNRWDWLIHVLDHPLLHRVEGWIAAHFPRLWRFVRQRFTLGQWYGLALTVAVVFVFLTLYLFALITEGWADREALYAFDQQVYTWLIQSIDGNTVAVMRRITHFGDALTIVLLSLALAAYLAYRRDRWRIVSLFLAVGVGSAVMWGLKALFARARPEERLSDALGHSFPSGHAFIATVFYGFLIYLTWRTVRHDAVRIGVTVLLALLILLVALSRVILRVHWVSDVAGGLSVGLGWLVSSLILTRALRAYRTSAHPAEA